MLPVITRIYWLFVGSVVRFLVRRCGVSTNHWFINWLVDLIPLMPKGSA
jgi:hypothetical protein